jgi:Esterase/lipase
MRFNLPRRFYSITLVVFVCFAALGFEPAMGAPAHIEKNLVYGMVSGTALLLDVYYPVKPNGYGIVFVPGSGWQAASAYNEVPLNMRPSVEHYGGAFVDAGYTVFVPNHRAAPMFVYPAAVKDIERAVRFVRYNAARFGIRPDRIGGSGTSSGGHLMALMALRDGLGNPEDSDPVNRESAKIQCFAAQAPTTDFLNPEYKSPNMPVFMGFAPDEAHAAVLREASPITYVSRDDPPFLMVHGDRDALVPFAESMAMENALRRKGVPVKLVRVPGGTHSYNFGEVAHPPEYRAEMIAWFDRYLKNAPTTKRQ